MARAIFKRAVRWGLLATSPAEGLRAGSQCNPKRTVYVSRADIDKVLAECPDDHWRIVIGLTRLAGLRCPSELAELTWADVLWDKRRLTVRSPKTAAHAEGASRVVPLDPALYELLLRAFDRAEAGVPWVLPRLRSSGINLRTQFERLIERAGLEPWPRLFHNLRASCAMDWAEKFPGHVVARWLGHSPLIAAQHYTRSRDMHFDEAAGLGDSEGGAKCGAPSDETRGAERDAAPRRTSGREATKRKEPSGI